MCISVIAKTSLPYVDGKLTKECFVEPGFRDSEVDKELPDYQPKSGACVVSTIELEKDLSSLRLAAITLNVPDSTKSGTLEKLLLNCGNVISLVQAEEMMKETERGSKTGITNERGTVLFLENKNHGVSVGYIVRTYYWRLFLFSMNANLTICAGNRILIREFYDSKLRDRGRFIIGPYPTRKDFENLV